MVVRNAQTGEVVVADVCEDYKQAQSEKRIMEERPDPYGVICLITVETLPIPERPKKQMRTIPVRIASTKNVTA